MRPLLLLSLTLAASGADLGGLGEDPVPGGTSTAWLYWQNDGFGPSFGRNSDDFRSNALGLGLRVEEVVIGVDFSLMTDSNPTQSKPAWGTEDPSAPMRVGERRVDELTMTLAWATGSDGWELRIGPGVRATGDLGGQALQERTHLILGQTVFDLPYERNSLDWDGLGYVRAGGPIQLVGPVALDLRGIAVGTTAGEFQGQASAELIAAGPGGALWLSAERQFRGGETPTGTQASVAREEEGTWIGAGISASLPPLRLSFSAARQWSNNNQMGVLTVATDPARAKPPRGWRFTGEAGAIPRMASGDGRGQQYRLLAAPPGSPISYFADVQDIASEPPSHLDLTGRRQQAAIGVRWELAETPGWHPLLGADAAFGVCQARLANVGWTTIDYEDQAIANTAALHGGPFAGIGWKGENGASLGLSLAADGFLPFQEESVELETLDPVALTPVKTETYDLLRTDVAYVVRVRATISW